MQNSKTTAQKIIDNIIFGCVILFLVTLSNSIFLNQLGYYGALLALIARYFVTKKNPFTKTGLELPFAIYIAAEILSTIFSLEPSHSFHNLLKRVLLIPIVYTFLSVTDDNKQLKKIIIIYLAASLLTMCYYLVVSYDYFINNLYQLKESGPAIFQYAITSSELMSFSLTILFAFLINEKTTLAKKSFLFILFLINLLALLATYKRTGLMGAAAGLFLIIILKRKWYLIAPVVILFIGMVLIEKNISRVITYQSNRDSLTEEMEINTNGRAFNLFEEEGKLYVSDYENGLLELKNGKVINRYNFDAPVTEVKKWDDTVYVANLVDSRFVLMKKKSGSFDILNKEFMTPGLTTDWEIFNDRIYAADKDSGLTVFENPEEPRIIGRSAGNEFSNVEKVFVDSTSIVLYSPQNGTSIYSLKNFMPDTLIFHTEAQNYGKPILYADKKLMAAEKEGLRIFAVSQKGLTQLNYVANLPDILSAESAAGKTFLLSTKGDLYQISFADSNIKIELHSQLGFVPRSITADSNKIFVSNVKRSRLASSLDPYHPSNFARLAFWRAGLKIFFDHPIFGVGDIDLAKLYVQYKRNFDKEIQGHMHNNFVHILVTLGAVGFIAFIFLLIKIFIVHFKNYVKVKEIPFVSSYVLGAFGGYAAFIFAGLTEWNFGDHEIITMVWFTLAVSIAVTRAQKNSVVQKD